MRVLLVLPSRATMQWHRLLATALREIEGVGLAVAAVPSEPVVAAVDLVGRLERHARRMPADHPTETIPAAAVAAPGPADAAADLVLDLSGDAGPPPIAGPDRLVLGCGGQRVDLGAAAAILGGGTPVLTLDLHRGGHTRRLAAWALAVENRVVLTAALADVYGRAVQLAALAVGRLAAGLPVEALALGVADPVDAAAPGPGAGGFLLAGLVEAARRRLLTLLDRHPQWLVAWRAARAGGEMPDLSGPFNRLPDDGRRFFADPFPILREGRRMIFVEELPFSTGKGLISAVELQPDGRVQAVHPVMEQTCHLSYPYLFEVDDTLYMIPETSGRRVVELWRCVRFPDRFEKVAVLIDGVDLSDATVVRDGAGWLLFAASRERWGSSWDALDLWRAPDLFGPWTRVGDGPVVVDPRVARPGGPPLMIGGRMVRPVQDCSLRYGGALAFVAVDWSGGRYAQTLLHRADPAPPFIGLHSFVRGGGIEAIDLYGHSRQPVVNPVS